MLNTTALPIALRSPVAFVCHDAGAANLVFAWLREWAEAGLLDKHEFKLLLQGPTKKAWQLEPLPLLQIQLHTELPSALTGCQSVLTGTGWASSLEHDARQLAGTLQIPSIAVIDHWVNYTQRFERDGVVALPNQIWVSDGYAVELATKLFKDIPIVELPNTYLKNLVKSIAPVPKDCKNLLYVLEPIRNDWGRGRPGEFQALDFFVNNLETVVGQEPVHIMLRPHPSDSPDKYNDWLKAHSSLDITLDSQNGLNEAISQARWVVGAETFAMVVASVAGRKTYSSLPPWANRCSLPISDIIHLRDLVEG
jgi:hypothetical protein